MELRDREQKKSGKGNVFIMNEIRRGRQEYTGDSTMMVSVQSYEERVPKGAFICFDYNCIYEFQGFDQMLLVMEDIMDSVSVPKAAYEHRSVYGKMYAFQRMEKSCLVKETGCRPEDIPRLPRGKAAFAIRFYYRQYGSLQGELLAVTDGEEKRVLFRSALELMRLLHEYTDTEMRRCL